MHVLLLVMHVLCLVMCVPPLVMCVLILVMHVLRDLGAATNMPAYGETQPLKIESLPISRVGMGKDFSTRTRLSVSKPVA